MKHWDLTMKHWDLTIKNWDLTMKHWDLTIKNWGFNHETLGFNHQKLGFNKGSNQQNLVFSMCFFADHQNTGSNQQKLGSNWLNQQETGIKNTKWWVYFTVKNLNLTSKKWYNLVLASRVIKHSWEIAEP